MTREQKFTQVSRLTEEFAGCEMIVCDYRGLSVKKLELLRKTARQSGVKVHVIKNTLAKIALKNAGRPEMSLRDSNIFAWGDEQISLAKIVCKFADENKENFVVKSGIFDEQIVDPKHIETISKLPSKEELIGMLLSVWNAPLRYFVTALDNLKKKKEEN